MKGEIFAIAAAVLWGLVPVIDKVALASGISIYTANFIRSVGAVVTILIISLLVRQLDFSILNAKIAAYLIISGAIAGAFAVVLYFSALKSIGASRTVPITAAYPMFTALFSFLLLSEEINLRVLAGIVMIVIGIILVSEV